VPPHNVKSAEKCFKFATHFAEIVNVFPPKMALASRGFCRVGVYQVT